MPDFNIKRRVGRHLEDMGHRLLPEIGAQLGTQVCSLTACTISVALALYVMESIDVMQ